MKNRSRLIRVKNDDLLFVEALKDYVVVHTTTESYTIHSTMKDVETKLSGSDFMRVHRSYIVNIEAIESIKYSMITIRGMEKEIPWAEATRTRWHNALTCCNTPARNRIKRRPHWLPFLLGTNQHVRSTHSNESITDHRRHHEMGGLGRKLHHQPICPRHRSSIGCGCDHL